MGMKCGALTSIFCTLSGGAGNFEYKLRLP